MSPNLPLKGMTLLDLGGMGPSARCTRVLADLGARWVRILAPSGAGRVRPQGHDYGAMRGAELIELDLKAPGASAVFLKMAQKADIIVEAFRPGVAARLGVAYPAVKAVNQGIVYCATTGYGQDGPYAQHAGHDLNYQAISGALAGAGLSADGTPALPGLTLADSAGGGWQAAIRILAALLSKQATGEGAYIDAAAAEGVLHLMAGSIDDYLANGKEPREGLFGGRFACYNIYAAADEKHLAVAALEPKFFATLCEALCLPQLTARQYDEAAQPELRKILADTFRTRPQSAWLELLKDKDVCVSPVLSVAEVVQDPHWAARGMFRSYDHPANGRSRQLAAFGAGRPTDRGEVPMKTAPDSILSALGFETAEIDRLKQNSIVS